NTFDPDLIQKGYATLGARIGIGPNTGLWQIAFVGRNLTNKRYIQFGGDTPLSGSTFGVNSDYAFADRGRTLAVQARVIFLIESVAGPWACFPDVGRGRGRRLGKPSGGSHEAHRNLRRQGGEPATNPNRRSGARRGAGS